MATAKFTGQVRGYSIDDDGDVHLTVEDTEVSESAQFYVHDLERNFNPQSNLHGFGAKDVPCSVRPGFAGYYFTLKPDKCKGINFGALVEVEMDIYHVRKVKFFNKRWASIAELRHDLKNIRLVQESRQDAKPEAAKAK